MLVVGRVVARMEPAGRAGLVIDVEDLSLGSEGLLPAVGEGSVKVSPAVLIGGHAVVGGKWGAGGGGPGGNCDIMGCCGCIGSCMEVGIW